MSQGEKATVLCDAADVRALAAAGLANAAGDHLSGAEGWATVEVRVCGVLQRRDLGGGGSKTRLVRGEGEFPADCPLHDCEVRVRAVGRDPESGAVFWQTEGAQASAMELGEAVMPDALERGIRLMTPGEIALVEVPAGDMKDDVAGGNPGGGRGQYLVELVSFDRLEDGAEGDADGMLKRANDMKQVIDRGGLEDAPDDARANACKSRAISRLGNANR